jgi:hypothetical protein
MSSFKISPLTLQTPPIHFAFSPSSDLLAFLYPNGDIMVWNLSISKLRPPDGKLATPVQVSQGKCENLVGCRQIALWETESLQHIAVLGVSRDGPQRKDAIQIFESSQNDMKAGVLLQALEAGSGRLVSPGFERSDLIWQSSVGQLFHGKWRPYSHSLHAHPRFV